MKKVDTLIDDPAFRGALDALKRARRAAEDTARRTHTALVVVVDGVIVRREPADPTA